MFTISNGCLVTEKSRLTSAVPDQDAPGLNGSPIQKWLELKHPAPPLYIQEKVHPKVLIDDLVHESKERAHADVPQQMNLFADFKGLPSGATATEFYQQEANWSNRMILGDSLQVMASLAEREGLHGYRLFIRRKCRASRT